MGEFRLGKVTWCNLSSERMKLPDLLWQEVEQCGWRYESWLQANYGKAPAEPVDDDGETNLKRSEVETKTLDTNNLKPGVKLTKQKVAKWKEADHYGILGLQDLRFDATTRQIRAAHRALSLRVRINVEMEIFLKLF